MSQTKDTYYKRDFWAVENLNYSAPHFRLEKAARLLNGIAGTNECDLLDVGCGPAALMRLLRKNIHYYGIDIAIQSPAPNLLQADFLEAPIRFEDKRFDIILAQGVFEYVGTFQSQKLSEIAGLLRHDGTFLVSYVNFDHIDCLKYSRYNNMLKFDEFRQSLEQFFHIDKILPTSHHWRHQEPNQRLMKSIQMHVNARIPIVSSLLAVEYFFICSPKTREPGRNRA